MTRIIDTNKHGIRREIDHQWKPKKKAKRLSTGNKELSTKLSTEDSKRY